MITDVPRYSRVLHSTIGACRLTATATATVVILGGPSSGLGLHTGGLAYRGSHPSDVSPMGVNFVVHFCAPVPEQYSAGLLRAVYDWR